MFYHVMYQHKDIKKGSVVKQFSVKMEVQTSYHTKNKMYHKEDKDLDSCTWNPFKNMRHLMIEWQTSAAPLSSFTYPVVRERIKIIDKNLCYVNSKK